MQSKRRSFLGHIYLGHFPLPTKLPLRTRVAQALTHIFPDGRPSRSPRELQEALKKEAPELGTQSDRVVWRAIKLAWPARTIAYAGHAYAGHFPRPIRRPKPRKVTAAAQALTRIFPDGGARHG